MFKVVLTEKGEAMLIKKSVQNDFLIVNEFVFK